MLACHCLLLVLAASAPAPAGTGRPGARTDMEAVRAALQGAGGQRAGDDTLVRRLTALGPSVAPALFSLVTGEGVDELLGEQPGRAWLCAPDRVGELALRALDGLPRQPVLACLRAALVERPEREVRAGALRVLGELGSAEALDFFLECLAACGEELELRAVRALARDALVAILRSDARAFPVLERRLERATIDVQRLACEALAGSGRAEAAALLERLAGRDPELDLEALEGLCRLAETHPWRMTGDVAARLRGALEHADPRLRAAAARALGRLREVQSIPALVAHLEDPERAVARAALWALRECSGQAGLSTSAEWKTWFQAELSWWQDRGRALLEELDPDQPAAWAAALRELCLHRTAREPLAESLAERLGELPVPLRALACSTLAELGARASVPALVECLFESDPLVRDAAWQALRALTGQDLPAEPRVWEEYAFG